MSVVPPFSLTSFWHHLFPRPLKLSLLKFPLSIPSSQMTNVILEKVKKHLLKLNPGAIENFSFPMCIKTFLSFALCGWLSDIALNFQVKLLESCSEWQLLEFPLSISALENMQSYCLNKFWGFIFIFIESWFSPRCLTSLTLHCFLSQIILYLAVNTTWYCIMEICKESRIQCSHLKEHMGDDGCVN